MGCAESRHGRGGQPARPAERLDAFLGRVFETFDTVGGVDRSEPCRLLTSAEQSAVERAWSRAVATWGAARGIALPAGTVPLSQLQKRLSALLRAVPSSGWSLLTLSGLHEAQHQQGASQLPGGSQRRSPAGSSLAFVAGRPVPAVTGPPHSEGSGVGDGAWQTLPLESASNSAEQQQLPPQRQGEEELEEEEGEEGPPVDLDGAIRLITALLAPAQQLTQLASVRRLPVSAMLHVPAQEAVAGGASPGGSVAADGGVVLVGCESLSLLPSLGAIGNWVASATAQQASEPALRGAVAAYRLWSPPRATPAHTRRAPPKLEFLWEESSAAGVTSLGYDDASRRLFVGTTAGSTRIFAVAPDWRSADYQFSIEAHTARVTSLLLLPRIAAAADPRLAGARPTPSAAAASLLEALDASPAPPHGAATRTAAATGDPLRSPGGEVADGGADPEAERRPATTRARPERPALLISASAEVGPQALCVYDAQSMVALASGGHLTPRDAPLSLGSASGAQVAEGAAQPHSLVEDTLSLPPIRCLCHDAEHDRLFAGADIAPRLRLDRSQHMRSRAGTNGHSILFIRLGRPPPLSTPLTRDVAAATWAETGQVACTHVIRDAHCGSVVALVYAPRRQHLFTVRPRLRPRHIRRA